MKNRLTRSFLLGLLAKCLPIPSLGAPLSTIKRSPPPPQQLPRAAEWGKFTEKITVRVLEKKDPITIELVEITGVCQIISASGLNRNQEIGRAHV